jgi:hypothetical protein
MNVAVSSNFSARITRIAGEDTSAGQNMTLASAIYSEADCISYCGKTQFNLLLSGGRHQVVFFFAWLY